jgi:hypothetical protein
VSKFPPAEEGPGRQCPVFDSGNAAFLLVKACSRVRSQSQVRAKHNGQGREEGGGGSRTLATQIIVWGMGGYWKRELCDERDMKRTPQIEDEERQSLEKECHHPNDHHRQHPVRAEHSLHRYSPCRREAGSNLRPRHCFPSLRRLRFGLCGLWMSSRYICLFAIFFNILILFCLESCLKSCWNLIGIFNVYALQSINVNDSNGQRRAA